MAPTTPVTNNAEWSEEYEASLRIIVQTCLDGVVVPNVSARTFTKTAKKPPVKRRETKPEDVRKDICKLGEQTNRTVAQVYVDLGAWLRSHHTPEEMQVITNGNLRRFLDLEPLK